MEKNTLEYKNYIGSVDFSPDDRVFHGKILGIKDMILFEGSTVGELEKDFYNAVDDYLGDVLNTTAETKNPKISKANRKPKP